MGKQNEVTAPDIEVAKVITTGGTQSRVQLSEQAVADYAEAMASDSTLPPIVVFHDGSAYWLADGFHRFHAHRKAGKDSIAADVRTGTKRDAILHAVGANSDHGLRRTNEDKRRAVRTLLADGEWRKWSDRLIAKACGVSVPFVGAIRNPEVAEKQREARAASAAKGVIGLHPGPQEGTRKQAESRHPPAKPEAKPEPAKPVKPKKGEPTVESLQAENAALREELHEARDVARNLAHELESYEAVTAGEKAAAKELTRLKGLLSTVEATRDQWMTTAGELRKEVKALQRKLGARK